MAAKKDNTNLYLGIGALVLIYIAGNKIFQKVGLTKTEEDKTNEALSTKAEIENYFDPAYYDERHKKYTLIVLTPDSYTNLARTIYNAKGFLNDDESAVYGAFRQIGAKVQVSQLARTFYNFYKKDLVGYLKSFLNSDEYAQILKITDKLPQGIKQNGKIY